MGKSLKQFERNISKGVSSVTHVPKILKRSSDKTKKFVSNIAGVSAKNRGKIGKSWKTTVTNVFKRKRSRHDVSVAFDKKGYNKIIRKIYREENEYVKLLRRFISTYYEDLVDPCHVGSDYELLTETFSTLAKIAAFHYNFSYVLKEKTKGVDNPQMGPALTEFFDNRKVEFLEEYRKFFDTLVHKAHSAIKRASHHDPNFLKLLTNAKNKDKDHLNFNDFLSKPKERIETLKSDLYNALEILDQGSGFLAYKGSGHSDKNSVAKAYDTVCEVADIAFKRGVFFRNKLESLKNIVK